jgi:predicted metal-dependent enzyme (double-stranded beta helix superfamily)
MSFPLTTASIATWDQRILATIDACIELGRPDIDRICTNLTEAVNWANCPRVAQSPDVFATSYRRILLSDGFPRSYEALLIVWPPGHETPVHDHDGLWGMELVLDGALEIEAYEVAEDHSLSLLAGETIVAGVGDHVVFTESTYAHRCRNLSRNRAALSLHVYGGELSSYRSFHQEMGRWSSQSHEAVRETYEF